MQSGGNTSDRSGLVDKTIHSTSGLLGLQNLQFLQENPSLSCCTGFAELPLAVLSPFDARETDVTRMRGNF